MDDNQWKQLDELFDAALDLPKSAREAFLNEKCAGNEQLKLRLEKLLKATTTDNFLEKSAMNVMARNLADEPTIVVDRQIIGRLFGTYRVEHQIGAGGMGEVYLATDEKLKRKVALKILPNEYKSNDERVKRFEIEAQAISALNHPNIVTIHDVGNADNTNFIATEYVDGKTLRVLIGQQPKLPDILNIIMQVCDALAVAHSHGIIHRDIKPENIMLRPDGYVKILDFGLAKLNETGTRGESNFAKTAKGIIIGTPAYMSPEQATDDNVDHRTDLWSVGVVLYELLTGVNPYKKESRQATFQSILLDEPPLASTKNAEVTGELDRILFKALEKDPDVSYQTANDLRADLKRVLREIDSSSRWNKASTAENPRKTKRRRRVLFVFAVFAALFLGSFSVLYLSYFQTAAKPVDWSRARTIQLTDQPGSEIFPTLAPDGKSFVFAAKSSRGDFDLFLQRVGDKQARNITDGSAGDDTQAVFSPDGERIAFHSERAANAGIYIMSASGENVRRISDFGFHPSWSPDGKEIVVSTGGQELPDVRNGFISELWIINVESGAKRLLIKEDAMQPAWSPDGKYIAYWFYPPNVGRRDIGIVPVGGGAPIVITKEGTTNWNPVWSPDGGFLYFASDRGGSMNFWRLKFAGGAIISEPEAVVLQSKYSRHLAFSQDSTRLIYVSSDNRSNIKAAAFDPEKEKVSGESIWITSGDRQISRPDLSPDGSQFVFQLSRRTQDDLVIIGRDGSNPRDLTNDAAFDRYPRWSPDGKRITFVSDRSGNYEIWMIDADGTNLRQVTFTGTQGTSFPLWSADGKRLLYRSTPHNYLIETAQNWKEQTPVRLSEFDPTDARRFVPWDWSADMMRVAGSISGEPMEAGYFDFSTGRYESVAKISVFPAWLPDNRRMLYAYENRLYIVDVLTKKTRELDFRPTEEIRSVGISRDGKLIYLTLKTSESDISLLDVTQP